jgi:hypothetical protein
MSEFGCITQGSLPESFVSSVVISVKVDALRNIYIQIGTEGNATRMIQLSPHAYSALSKQNVEH